jgi:hypothetical protein
MKDQHGDDRQIPPLIKTYSAQLKKRKQLGSIEADTKFPIQHTYWHHQQFLPT